LRVLNSERLAELLEEFTYRLGETGEAFNCIVVGGAALALSVRPDRPATEDVDVFAQLTPAATRLVKTMAQEHNLRDPEWLNAKAQTFMSPTASHNEQDLAVIFQHRNVVVRVLDAPSLFAMKCRAGRISKDGGDLVALADRLQITSIDEATRVMDDYYDGEELMKPHAREILKHHFRATRDPAT